MYVYIKNIMFVYIFIYVCVCLFVMFTMNWQITIWFIVILSRNNTNSVFHNGKISNETG